MDCCFFRFTSSAGNWERDPCWFWFFQSWIVGSLAFRFDFLKVCDTSLNFYHFILVLKNKNITAFSEHINISDVSFWRFLHPYYLNHGFSFSPFVIRCCASDCPAIPIFKLKDPPPKHNQKSESGGERQESCLRRRHGHASLSNRPGGPFRLASHPEE